MAWSKSYRNSRPMVAPNWAISRTVAKRSSRAINESCKVDGIAKGGSYFRGKDEIYRVVLDRLLDTWLAPLHAIEAAGDPMLEIAGYIHRKLEMARDQPRESRLFAGEIMRGAPILDDVLSGPLKALVDEKCTVIEGWIEAGLIAPVDPRHLIFAIWATTQHYADFDTQIRAVLGDPDTGGGEGRFSDAARFLERLFLDGLRPR